MSSLFTLTLRPRDRVDQALADRLPDLEYDILGTVDVLAELDWWVLALLG
jgi:hypothetical protein